MAVLSTIPETIFGVSEIEKAQGFPFFKGKIKTKDNENWTPCLIRFFNGTTSFLLYFEDDEEFHVVIPFFYGYDQHMIQFDIDGELTGEEKKMMQNAFNKMHDIANIKAAFDPFPSLLSQHLMEKHGIPVHSMSFSRDIAER